MASGATLNVGANVNALIQSQPLTDSGALTFATGDTVLQHGNTQIVVNGILNAAGNDSFLNNNGNYFIHPGQRPAVT